MDQTYNRSFTAYLDSIHQYADIVGGKGTFAVVIDLAGEWLRELTGYLDGAKNELPVIHPDRPKFDSTKQSIKLTYDGYREAPVRFRANPSTIVHQLAVAYSQVGRLIIVKPSPRDHTIKWGVNNEYLFVRDGSTVLDERDVAELYLALQVEGRRHRSALERNAPADMVWYTHDHGRNRLLAVTAFSWDDRTIFVPKDGKVNDGVHRFG